VQSPESVQFVDVHVSPVPVKEREREREREREERRKRRRRKRGRGEEGEGEEEERERERGETRAESVSRQLATEVANSRVGKHSETGTCALKMVHHWEHQSGLSGVTEYPIPLYGHRKC